MNSVFLSLGSNRGNRCEYLQKAISLLEERAGKVVKRSSVYETQPWQMTDSTNFLNQVILLQTKLDAQHLMDIIIQTETGMGRIRTKSGYEPRTIDIDILFFNDEVIDSDTLKVPHPQIHKRRFILEPLCEIDPLYVHPVLKRPVKQLLVECPDTHTIAKYMSK